MKGKALNKLFIRHPVLRCYTTAPPPTSHLLRDAMRRTAQPVSAITIHLPHLRNTTQDPTHPLKDNYGATLSSLASISLSPPLVSFSLRIPSRLASFLLLPTSPPPKFTVHLLSSLQEDVARAFARQDVGEAAPAWAREWAKKTTEERGDGFPTEAFEELHRNSLARLSCVVVESQVLAGLRGESSISKEKLDEDAEVTKGGQGSTLSMLFIAEVLEVVLVKDLHPLLYRQQSYMGVNREGTDPY